MDRTAGDGGRSLTSCRKAASVLADGRPCNSCGCSSAGRARPRHGRGHEFETRHPLHFGCVLSLRCRATWCWRCGMCAALGQATCSETPHPTGCSRLGTAEVDFHRPRSGAGTAASLQAAGRARSSRCRGHHPSSRVRLDGQGHHPFKVDTRVRTPHATPAQGTLVELTLRGGNRPQRLGGAGTRDRMDSLPLPG